MTRGIKLETARGLDWPVKRATVPSLCSGVSLHVAAGADIMNGDDAGRGVFCIVREVAGHSRPSHRSPMVLREHTLSPMR